MIRTFVVPLKYFVEVQIETSKDVVVDKQDIITKAIKQFEKDFKNDPLNEIAESMSPSLLSDVHEVK